MRSAAQVFLVLCAVFTALPAAAQSDVTRPLIDPNFAIPDLVDQVSLLEERFEALAAHLRAMEERQDLDGVDARLEELFLPERPKEFRARYRTELLIAQSGGDVGDWQTLAEKYLRSGRLDDAKAAAFRVQQTSRLGMQKAVALAIMAEAALAQGDVRLAMNLYRRSLDTHRQSDAQRRFNALLERYDLKLKDIALEVEQTVPSACIIFSQTLRKGLPLKPEDYIRIDPGTDIDVEAKDNQICLRGLGHGRTYNLTVRAGLAGADSARLYGEAKRRFVVPDRRERVLFSTSAYVLPRSAHETLPVKTVNLDTVKLKLYRVHDRNLVNTVIGGLLDSDLYPANESAIEQTTGALVWQGEITVTNKRNTEATTLIPLADMFEQGGPGIYALVARPPKEEGSERWRRHATQWLVISDLGLMTFRGADGLHALVRSLDTAEPIADVELTLVARNNVVLGSARTDSGGIAQFAPGLTRGPGGNQPALLTAATEDGDYNFIRLAGPSLDLSERGVAGRPAPGELDAFLYPDRGVYRPGESVYMSALLRNSEARAIAKLPLRVKVVRPGGTEVYDRSIVGDDLGGYLFEIPLSSAARAGTWTATAYIDDGSAPVGSTTFSVQDFVPQRIAASLTTDARWLVPGSDTEILLSGKFLYGPPAADLKTEARLALLVNPAPYEGYEDYHFGLVQEEYRPQRQSIESPRTDPDGESTIHLRLDRIPDTSHSLMVQLQVSLFDLGGRPVNTSLRLPLRTRAVEVGLRPVFSGALGPDDEAAFDIVALDAEGMPVSGRAIAYEWVREHHDYSWYQQGGEWRVRTTIYDEAVATGEVSLDQHGRARLQRRPGNGRFRLDVFDASGSSAASHRFHVGWWSSSTAPDVPDALELTLEQADLSDGDTLKAFVRGPFAGSAYLTVMNDRLQYSRSLLLPEEGMEIELPVEADWGPGAYLMVTAFRPEAGRPSRLPMRAMGLGWFSIDRKKREVGIRFQVPQTVLPRQTVTLPLVVEGASGADKRMRVTLAAVDEGILQLTGFATPRPEDHYLGRRRLGIDIHDLYGRLIRPAEGQRGQVRSGGDAAKAFQNVQGITLRTVKTVALYQRDIFVDAEGRASVTLDLPDFNGSLRLMAVAYGEEVIGSGESRLIVRDPVVADVLLPRFLAPGDAAQATLSLHNLSGKATEFTVSIEGEGSIGLGRDGVIQIELEDEERYQTVIELEGTKVGDGHITLTVSGEGIEPIIREWDIEVRPAQPYVTERRITYIAPDEAFTYAAGALGDYLLDTVVANVTVAARPEFNVPDLLDALDRYPYGCTEQTVSRALPLLYFGGVARLWNQEPDDLAVQRTIDRSILRILERQRGDGSFAAWQSFGRQHLWLSAYVFDFLTRARDSGYDVPRAAYGHIQNWLQGYVVKRGSGALYAKAYAYYALARVGEVKAGDVRYFAETYADQIRTRLGLGHVAAALAILGERGRAEDLFESAIAKRRPRNAHIPDYGSDLRDGAAIAALLGEAFPQSERQQRLATALERQFDRREYFSTQEQAWLLLATHALGAGSAADLSVRVDGESVGPQRQALRLALNYDRIELGLTVENQGSAPIRFIEALRGVPKDPLPAASNGFRLKRTFYTLDGRLADLSAVTQNDQFIVLIEGEAENRTDHEALLVDLLPAGFEIENADLGGTAGQERLQFLPSLSRFEFEAARDDRYVAAINLGGSRRKFALAYIARAVTPGRFTLPGSFIEDMYRPQYHARTASSMITIARP